MKRILVCLDSSDLAPLVYRASLEMARAADATLSLLRVVVGAGELAASDDLLRAAAQADLADLARADTPTVHADLRVVLGSSVSDAICVTAREEKVDLIVLGARPHGFVERALGTIAASVVNHSACSVFVVRPERPVNA